MRMHYVIRLMDVGLQTQDFYVTAMEDEHPVINGMSDISSSSTSGPNDAAVNV